MERERLFQSFLQNEGDIDVTKYPNQITSTGLPAYTFRDNAEFLAETLEIFYKKPEMLHNSSKKPYNIYRDYFKLDPLNGYSDTEY